MDKVSICNMALRYMGLKGITSLDETSPSAETMRTYYDEARRCVLADHPWNFALARKKLTMVQPEDAWCSLFRLAYMYPSDALHIWRICSPIGKMTKRFEVADHVQSTVILTNVQQAQAVYTRDVKDVSRYSPIFVQALVRKLQAMTVVSLLKNVAAVEPAENMYQVELSRAKTSDANEGMPWDAEPQAWNGRHDTPVGDWVDVIMNNYNGM